MKYKGGKRTDRGPISYRVKGHRLKVNASKSYSVHSLVLLLFSLTLSVPGWAKEKVVIKGHVGIFNLGMVTGYRTLVRLSIFGLLKVVVMVAFKKYCPSHRH